MIKKSKVEPETTERTTKEILKEWLDQLYKQGRKMIPKTKKKHNSK